MSIAGNGRYTLNPEVEGLSLETCLLQKGNQERSQASVNMKWNSLSKRNLAQSGDIINDSMRKVRRRSDNHDRIVVHETADGLEVDFESNWINSDMVDLDSKVMTSY